MVWTLKTQFTNRTSRALASQKLIGLIHIEKIFYFQVQNEL